MELVSMFHTSSRAFRLLLLLASSLGRGGDGFPIILHSHFIIYSSERNYKYSLVSFWGDLTLTSLDATIILLLGRGAGRCEEERHELRYRPLARTSPETPETDAGIRPVFVPIFQACLDSMGLPIESRRFKKVWKR